LRLGVTDKLNSSEMEEIILTALQAIGNNYNAIDPHKWLEMFTNKGVALQLSNELEAMGYKIAPQSKDESFESTYTSEDGE
jgi:hypothetical protein